MRIVMLCFALLAATRAFAQDAPEKAVRDIRDVQIGMSRDHVLAGLADQYQCSRLFGSEAGGFEAWSASPKHGPESSAERESAIVTFRKGKALTVDIKLYPSMMSAEA